MGVGSESLLLSESATGACFFTDDPLASMEKASFGDFPLLGDGDVSPEIENGLAGLMDFTADELALG